MKRTVTIITSILILCSSVVFAIDTKKEWNEETIGEYTLEELEGLPTEALKKLYEETEDFRIMDMVTSRWRPSVSESAGSRTLDTESEPNDDYTTADAITDSMSAAISTGGEVDYFSFTAIAGTEYTFETHDLPGSSNNVVDTKLYLYDTDGTSQLDYNDDGGASLYSLIAYTISTAGTYYVKVIGYSSSYTGDYLLTMTSAIPQVDPYEPNNTLATATAIASGDSLVGPMIDPAGDHDFYVFTGAAGYSVNAQTVAVDGVTMDTKLYLLGSDSTQLAYDDDGGEDYLSWIRGYVLPSDGTYYLKATGYSSSTTGSYNIELDVLAPSAYAGVIVVNEIMQNPSAVYDSNGEYLELINTGATAVDVEGWTLADIDYEIFVLHGDTTGYGYDGGGGTTLISAGGYLVLGINADQTANGGAPVDYEYGGYGNPDAFSLANGSDEVLLLDAAGSIVDMVYYDGGPIFPDPNGLSMEFIPDSLAVDIDNNRGTAWQEAWETFGDGDFGSPGAANSVAPLLAPILISEIVVTPTAGEMIEIYNPNALEIDLSGFYLTDATHVSSSSYYYNIVTGAGFGDGNGSSSDFHVKFPADAAIAAGEYLTISLNGSDSFVGVYGVAPDFELKEDAAAADSIPDMVEIVTGSVGSSAGLSNSGEVVILYYWDGESDLVMDSDYIVWGDKAEAVDKTGISVDGPDTDTDATAYLADTPIASQPTPADNQPHPYGFSYHRIDNLEGSEVLTGGNGIDGNDETSENTDTTFAVSFYTPGGPAQTDLNEPNDTLSTATAITAPDTLTGLAIDPVDDLDWFSFSANRWEKVTIDMFINGYSSLDGEIALFDADSTKLASADVGFSGGDERIANFEILETGTYYVVAGYWGDVRASTGEYALGVAVTPAPSTGFVAGTVTDSETGSALDSAMVTNAYGSIYSSSAGAYIFETPVGLTDVSFAKVGYNAAFFAVQVDSGDTVDLNVALAPEFIDNLYSTGFETGDDAGSSSSNSDYNFAVLDTMFNADGDTVLPSDGTYMLAYPDTAGVTYNNDDLAIWVSDSVVDIASFVSLQMSLDAIYDTENGWDYFYIGLLLDDGYIYYSADGEVTGSQTSWETINIDVSWAANLSATATPAIIFDSDGSVSGYWGGAFDNVKLIGNTFFLAPPTALVAENYGATIPLAWDAPASGGRVTYGLHRADLDNIQSLTRPMIEDENGQMVELVKGPRDYEQLVVDYQYSGSSSRSLSHYNVFRADWPFGGYSLLGTTTTNSYDDADVSDGDYIDYFVTAVYDEGETVSSNEINARAGLPVVLTDDAYGGEDFEDGFAFENWEQFNSTANAMWVVGDSTAADSAFGIGSSVNPAPDHTNFAYISDGRAGDADFKSILISPFLDFSDNHTAVVKLAGYAQVYANSSYTPCYVIARADMGPWELLIDFSFDHSSGWGDYSASMDDVVAGSDYVQLAVTYGHLGGWNSGAGNGIAIDDLSLEIIPGPHSLALTPTISDVSLSWVHPDSTMANFSGPAIREISDVIAEKEQLSTVETIQDRDDCFNHMGALAYFWSFYDSLSGPTSLFTFNPGPMIIDELELGTYVPASAVIGGLPAVGQDISLAWVLAFADTAGVTVDTVAHGVHTFTAILNASSETIAIGGVSVMITDSTFLKVHYRPMTFADSVGTDGTVSAYLPAPLSDDGSSPTGLSGTDSAGVFYTADYNFDLAVCGTPTPPAISYNIYKDGIMAETGLEANTWTDENVSVVTESCYWVKGVVPMSFDMGMTSVVDGLVETEPTNVECGSAINQPPSEFTLLSPSDGDTILITPDNVGSNQLFAWTASSDPNGTQVEYNICWTLPSPFWQECENNGTQTANFVPLVEISDFIDSLYQEGGDVIYTFTWTVYATDGMAETEAVNGPRSITFDAGYALGVNDEPGIPDVFALHQNYPNPFNPVTTIRFDVPEESRVRMDIYNVLGQRVATLVNSTLQPGFHTIRWNGTNDFGKPLASGMYIYQIKAKGFVDVKKLVLMK